MKDKNFMTTVIMVFLAAYGANKYRKIRKRR
jgi:hypothetical protein